MTFGTLTRVLTIAASLLLLASCAEEKLPSPEDYEPQDGSASVREPKTCEEACLGCLANCRCDEADPSARICADGAAAYAKECSPIVLASGESEVLGGPGGMNWRFTNIGNGRAEIRQFMGEFFDENVGSSGGVFETEIGQLSVTERAGPSQNEVHLFAC